jgi:hypothetical protein
MFPIYFNLADPNLMLAECGCFQFNISLLMPGSYWVEWFGIVEYRASEETANSKKWLAIVTSLSVFATLITAFTIFYLEGRRRKNSLFKSLYAEIEHNHSAAQKMIKIGRTQTVFALAPLDTLSYQNMRMTGEVLALSEELQRELDELYVLINTHNRQLPAVYELIPRESFACIA